MNNQYVDVWKLLSTSWCNVTVWLKTTFFVGRNVHGDWALLPRLYQPSALCKARWSKAATTAKDWFEHSGWYNTFLKHVLLTTSSLHCRRVGQGTLYWPEEGTNPETVCSQFEYIYIYSICIRSPFQSYYPSSVQLGVLSGICIQL